MEALFWNDRQCARACRMIARLGGWYGPAELFSVHGPTIRALHIAQKGRLQDIDLDDFRSVLGCTLALRLWFDRPTALDVGILFDHVHSDEFVDALAAFIVASRRGPAAIERWLRDLGDLDPQDDVDPDGCEDPGPDLWRDPVMVIDVTRANHSHHRTTCAMPGMSREEVLDSCRAQFSDGGFESRTCFEPGVRGVIHIGGGLTRGGVRASLRLGDGLTADALLLRLGELISPAGTAFVSAPSNPFEPQSHSDRAPPQKGQFNRRKE